MDLLRSAILGVIQGLTEFLPVSSDGHLLLVGKLFHWPDEGLAFDAALHLGTFAALLIVFHATWWRLLRSLWDRAAADDRRLLSRIVLATLPGAVAGFFGESFIGGTARSLVVAGIGFLVSAVLLVVAEVASARHVGGPRKDVLLISSRRALVIGVMQIFALLPGLSRSGATIAGGMFTGLSRSAAVEFSFLLALPITGAAGLKGLMEVAARGDGVWVSLLVGFLCALVSGVWAIRFLLGYVRHRSLMPFVLYLVGAALLAFVLT